MELWVVALAAGFVGYFVGTMAGMYFWQKYGDYFTQWVFKRQNNGEEMNFCLHCGNALKSLSEVGITEARVLEMTEHGDRP